jgi:hypothetical protein
MLLLLFGLSAERSLAGELSAEAVECLKFAQTINTAPEAFKVGEDAESCVVVCPEQAEAEELFLQLLKRGMDFVAEHERERSDTCRLRPLHFIIDKVVREHQRSELMGEDGWTLIYVKDDDGEFWYVMFQNVVMLTPV